jgi:hypothetical protein
MTYDKDDNTGTKGFILILVVVAATLLAMHFTQVGSGYHPTIHVTFS